MKGSTFEAAARSPDWLIRPFEASQIAPAWLRLGVVIAYTLLIWLIHAIAAAPLAPRSFPLALLASLETSQSGALSSVLCSREGALSRGNYCPCNSTPVNSLTCRNRG